MNIDPPFESLQVACYARLLEKKYRALRRVVDMQGRLLFPNQNARMTRESSAKKKYERKLPPRSGKLFLLLILSAIITSAHTTVFAGAYPIRAVKIVVPFTPGATVDVAARIIAAKLSAYWSQPVIVENHPGAGSTVGAKFVAEGSPDGYNLLFTLSDTFTVLPHLAQYQSFHPMSDLIPINLMAVLVDAIVANPSVPANTLPELISYARTHPGSLRYGSPGPGTNIHLSMEMLKSLAKIDMQHVPYRGLEPAVTATISNVVHVTQAGYSARDLITSGRLKILAVAGSKRFDAFPAIPTTAELGYGKVDSSSWLMIAAPAKTPETILSKLDADLSRLLGEPDIRQQLVQRSGLIISDIRRDNAAASLIRQSAARAEAVNVSGVNKD